MDKLRRSKTPLLTAMIDQPSPWASQLFGKSRLTQHHERGSPQASEEPLTSASSLPISPAFLTKEPTNSNSLIESDVTASTETGTQMPVSSKASTPPALLLHPTRALPDSLSISASVIDQQVPSHDPNANAMSRSSPVSISDDDSSEDERQRSGTDQTSLSYLPYGPPKQHHFQRSDQLRCSSSFGSGSDDDGGETEISPHSRADGFSAGVGGGGSPTRSHSVVDSDAVPSNLVQSPTHQLSQVRHAITFLRNFFSSRRAIPSEADAQKAASYLQRIESITDLRIDTLNQTDLIDFLEDLKGVAFPGCEHYRFSERLNTLLERCVAILEPSDSPQPTSIFETKNPVARIDSFRNSSASSDGYASDTPVSPGTLEAPVQRAGRDISDDQTSARERGSGTSRELTTDLSDRHGSTTSSSEHGSRGDDTELASSSTAASPVALSTIKPAQPQQDRPGSPRDELSLSTDPSTPATAPSSPVSTSITTPQTGMTSDIPSIIAKIKELADKLTEAAEVRDQENAEITRLSSDAAVLAQQVKRQQESLKRLFKQRREVNANIKGLKGEIKESEDELLIKNRAVNPHVEARDNAQHSINILGDEKRKQEKKLNAARYNEMLERNIPDPVLRSIGKRLEYGRGEWDLPSDTDSDGDEPTDRDDGQASDFGESENSAHVSDDEGGGHSSETVRSVTKKRSAEPDQSEAEDHLGEFVDNYTSLARKDPNDITIAEFSSMGQAFNKLNGSVKPELEDDKAAVKSEIKREPFIKTEPGATPDAGEPTTTGNIKPESSSSIKQVASPGPFADSKAGPSYPPLDKLTLGDFTADMLTESYKAAQYHTARIRKAFELLKGPAPSPSLVAATTSTRPRRLPVARDAIHSLISRNKRKRSSPSPDHDDDAEGAPHPRLPAAAASSPDGHDSDSEDEPRRPNKRRNSRKRAAEQAAASSDADSDDEDNAGRARRGGSSLHRATSPGLMAREHAWRQYQKKKPKLQPDDHD